MTMHKERSIEMPRKIQSRKDAALVMQDAAREYVNVANYLADIIDQTTDPKLRQDIEEHAMRWLKKAREMTEAAKQYYTS